MQKDEIIDIIESHLIENEMFMVSLSISPQNKVKLVVDKNQGITIEECIQVSRLIESKLDRDKEDFELEVTSPGIGKPFKVKEQYYKAQGKTIKVVCNDGTEIAGILTSATEDKFVVESTKKVKAEGKKKKEEVTETVELGYEQVKQAKEIIKF